MPKFGVAAKVEAVLPALIKSLVQRLNERPLGVRIKVLYCAEVGSSKGHLTDPPFFGLLPPATSQKRTWQRVSEPLAVRGTF